MLDNGQLYHPKIAGMYIVKMHDEIYHTTEVVGSHKVFSQSQKYQEETIFSKVQSF